MRFRSKERGTRVKTAQAKEWGGGEEERKETFFLPLPLPLFHFLALVSFLARPKPRILFLASFLGLFLLRNQTETLATQAIKNINKKLQINRKKKMCKENEYGHPDTEIRTYTITASCVRSQLPDQWATLPAVTSRNVAPTWNDCCRERKFSLHSRI